MSWKQHLAPLALAVMAVLALAVTANAQAQGYVTVSPNALSTVISPDMDNFTLTVTYVSTSNYTPYYIVIYLPWFGNTSGTWLSIYSFSNGTTESSASFLLPTPSKPGVYIGTVYIANSLNVVGNTVEASGIVWSGNFTVDAVPFDIVNYSWYVEPAPGAKCVTPGSTFNLVVPVYFSPTPAVGYVWANLTFPPQNHFVSYVFPIIPYQEVVVFSANFTAPSQPGNYSGYIYIGNYTTTFKVPWWVLVETSSCTPPSTPQVPLLPIIIAVAVAVAVAVALIEKHRKGRQREAEVSI